MLETAKLAFPNAKHSRVVDQRVQNRLASPITGQESLYLGVGVVNRIIFGDIQLDNVQQLRITSRADETLRSR